MNVNVGAVVVSSICCSRPLTQSKEIFIFNFVASRKRKESRYLLSIDIYAFSVQFSDKTSISSWCVGNILYRK